MKSIMQALLLAGIFILLTGLYYWLIKAGIPYQDAPLELQIKYAVNYGIGKTLTKTGFIIAVCGGIVSLILKWIGKGKK